MRHYLTLQKSLAVEAIDLIQSLGQWFTVPAAAATGSPDACHSDSERSVLTAQTDFTVRTCWVFGLTLLARLAPIRLSDTSSTWGSLRFQLSCGTSLKSVIFRMLVIRVHFKGKTLHSKDSASIKLCPNGLQSVKGPKKRSQSLTTGNRYLKTRSGQIPSISLTQVNPWQM